ncbi:MAG: recombination mediator RecR [Candidatus Gracilibacteria bacterium]|nr:recombination mediator RecR [Candidatus Gracilibacteria bacterium]MDQ7022811.1 recombination mediator RecR [Candidatus Gracilibacteria bacterium]
MPEALKNLINSISYLPGIGEKSANKLAFFLLNSNSNYLESFSQSLLNIKDKISQCKTCHSLIDLGQEECNICLNHSRNHNIIAVIEEYLDMQTIEQAGNFDGVYHILGGAISPINGTFVSDLNFNTLFERINNSEEKVEILLATNPNIEGEATTSYIIEMIEEKKLKHKTIITRLSRGLSSGYIEYADNITLANAIKERKIIS